MNPLAWFFIIIDRRKAARRYAEAVRRYHVIAGQIEGRKAARRAWKFLEGELASCRRTMLECEIVMRRKAGA
ncbi:hypothetical protein [Aliihoeflea sp. 2WW]|uniref:hypothetical protein n=1 Tax=Aliihoeflea sp. 2WW TaxID=1381123 RepID=UPI0004641E00|nr:hypothetical protein [Aliihoeflea sp. 2WW]